MINSPPRFQASERILEEVSTSIQQQKKDEEKLAAGLAQIMRSKTPSQNRLRAHYGG